MKSSNYTEQVMALRWKLNEAEIALDTAQNELAECKQQLADALTRIQDLERLIMRYETQRARDKEGESHGVAGPEPRLAEPPG